MRSIVGKASSREVAGCGRGCVDMHLWCCPIGDSVTIGGHRVPFVLANENMLKAKHEMSIYRVESS